MIAVCPKLPGGPRLLQCAAADAAGPGGNAHLAEPHDWQCCDGRRRCPAVWPGIPQAEFASFSYSSCVLWCWGRGRAMPLGPRLSNASQCLDCCRECAGLQGPGTLWPNCNALVSDAGAASAMLLRAGRGVTVRARVRRRWLRKRSKRTPARAGTRPSTCPPLLTSAPPPPCMACVLPSPV